MAPVAKRPATKATSKVVRAGARAAGKGSAAARPAGPARAGGKAASAKRGALLLDISGEGLVRATVQQRPSARNRSPWVADVKLESGRIALAHVPALDMGGKCVPGSTVLLKVAKDSKGKPVGPDAVGAYGTPKCEFIMQLVRVSEPENSRLGGCWVAGHPSLGERLAGAILEGGLAKELPRATFIQREVSGVAGTDMRADFVLDHSDASKTVVEVKTVLDTDYNPATPPPRKECVFFGDTKKYVRAGIFPWGSTTQQGPDGEAVVSARAIKHVDELAAIARGERRAPGLRLGAALLFVVVRHDVEAFRPNAAACPSFARHTALAAKSGVKVIAHRIRWGEGRDLGKAFWDGAIKVSMPKVAELSAARGRRPGARPEPSAAKRARRG